MSDARRFASNFYKATKVSVELAVKGFVQQIEYLNGLLNTAQENIKSLQDKIKSLEDKIETLTTQCNTAVSNQNIALVIMMQEQNKNTELLAKNTELLAQIAKLEAENSLLKAQHDQDCPLFY